MRITLWTASTGWDHRTLRSDEPPSCLDDIALLFWSVYPLQKGWLRMGDHAYIVYQQVTFIKTLRIAFTFSTARDSVTHGVAAATQAASVPLMLACITWFACLAPRPSLMAASACGGLLLVDALYIVLMAQAKRVLRQFINHPELT